MFECQQDKIKILLADCQVTFSTAAADLHNITSQLPKGCFFDNLWCVPSIKQSNKLLKHDLAVPLVETECVSLVGHWLNWLNEGGANDPGPQQ